MNTKLDTRFPKKSFKNSSDDLKNIPTTSGLYYFYDEADHLYYIGKAKRLKSRVYEHKHCNNRAREAEFYSKFLKMNLPLESRKKLDEAIRDFEFRGMSTINPIVNDFVFQRTTRIDIQEMPYDIADEMEIKMIWKLKPLFNYETHDIEYGQISGNYNQSKECALLNDSKCTGKDEQKYDCECPCHFQRLACGCIEKIADGTSK